MLVKRTIRGAVAVLAVVTMFLGAAPAQAEPGDPAPPAPLGTRENPALISASVGCGSVCDGQNPSTWYVYFGGYPETCQADATTVRSTKLGSFLLELRYSPMCRTAWTRVNSSSWYPSIRSYYLDGRVRTAYEGFAGGRYTVMVNDKNLLARAEANNGPTFAYTAKY